jgi:hypothetical protein
MSLLLEGITGIGKTHTTELLLKTILPPENYCVVRLSAAMTNVQQPYVEGVVDNGVLRVNLRREALDRIAAMFIDEQNRGDINQVLQLKDGKISLPSGESGYLGLPVPRIAVEQQGMVWRLDRENKRPLFVAAAQNPSASKAAQYSATRGTDAAVKDRDVEVIVPNAAGALGASITRVKQGNGQHREFVQRFSGCLASYLGIDARSLSATVGDDVTAWFALATDPARTARQELRSSMELSDVLSLMLSPDLMAEYGNDQSVANGWNDSLKARRIDFSYTSALTESAKSMEKIRKVVGSFAEQLVPRDIVKAKKLADALSLTRLVKQALSSPNNLETFLKMPSYITVQDVAGGYAIMARDKQQSQQEDSVTIIDQVLRDYVEIAQTLATSLGYRLDASRMSRFESDNPVYSVYSLALSSAISATRGAGAGGPTPLASEFIRSLGASVSVLRRAEGSSESKKPLVARMISDLATLAGFVDEYSHEIEHVLSQREDLNERLQALQSFYLGKKASASTADIYLQRLPRIMGV